MRKTPVLDKRDAQALVSEIQQRARSYTPEWRFEPEDMDAGGALAALFSRMFAQTLDRYNRVLHKDYIEFLNLLAVRQQPVTPAKGYVTVDIAEGTEHPVPIVRDTQFFRDDEDGTRVEYLSDETIYATAAQLTAVLTVDPAKDAIALRDPAAEESFALFHVPEDKNLQRHCFELAQDEVLRMSLPGVVAVEVVSGAQYQAQRIAKQLANAGFATWEYHSKGEWHAFDEVTCEGSKVLLTKHSDSPIQPVRPENVDEDVALAARSIRCVMRGLGGAELTVQALRVQSAYAQDNAILCDEAYANDVRVEAEAGGYCFEAAMMNYDAFYIGSDEVLCKRGATVTLRMNMNTLVRKAEQEIPLYEFKNKFVIDKEVTPPEPNKRRVSRVAWEYWNGVGWAHLNVSGNLNPFDGDSQGQVELTFRVPEDSEATTVASVDRHWIRARAVLVDNAFDPYATVLMPYASDIRMSYLYEEPRPVTHMKTENNLEVAEYTYENEKEIACTLYAPMEDKAAAVYLCFDSAPAGYPVSLYLGLQGRLRAPRRMQAEGWFGRNFEAVRIADGTEGYTRSGVMKLYLPQGLKQRKLLGQEGWFLRLSDTTLRAQQEHPNLSEILLNCVHITQRQMAAELRFSTDIHEAGKRIRVDELPVLEAEVQVDESAALSENAMDALLASGEAQEVREADGSLSRLWVKWRRVSSLDLCGAEDRAYVMDAESGLIAFGDGVHGRIPPAGEENILVRHSFGGGEQGNAAIGAVTGINTTEAGVTEVRNFLPICGGNDMQSLELVEKLGPQRLHHRGRAVTKADYEALVLEEFSEVRAVRCFPNTDENGDPAPGQVTVVVLAGQYESEPHAMAVCGEVEKYLLKRCDGALKKGGLHVVPAQVMTVSVTANVEVDDVDNAAAAESGVSALLDGLLDPLRPGEDNPIGALPTQAELYAALRRAPHVLAVRDMLLEGSYFDYNVSRVVPLDVGSDYPFAVPRSGSHTIRI